MHPGLLSRADADGLSAFYIAYGVGLCVFQGDEGNHQVNLGRIRKLPVLRDNILQKVPVDLQVVMSLLKGDAEYLLALQGLRLIVRINLDDIVITVFLGL